MKSLREKAEQASSASDAFGFKKAKILKSKNIIVGTQLLGVIKEINELYMIISLPYNMVGRVQITEASDVVHAKLLKVKNKGKAFLPLEEAYSIGQFVRTVVTNVTTVGKATKIELSMRESLVNAHLNENVTNTTIQGAIKSEEDHGYVVSVGIEGLSGFVKREDIKSPIHNGYKKPILLGQVFQFSIKANNKPVLSLCANFDQQSKAETKSVSDIRQIQPGMLVNARVDSALDNGIIVRFLQNITGTVDFYHFNKLVKKEDIVNTFKKKQHVLCRVIFSIEEEIIRIGLSLLPQTVQFAPVEFKSTVGQIFQEQDTKVLSADGSGILVQLPNSQTGFVHASKISDTPLEKSIESLHPVGSKVSCRILSLNYADQIYNLTMKTSDMIAQHLTLADVKIGSIVTATIDKVNPKFLAVKVDMLAGVCPKIHMAESKVTDPESWFKIGQKIRCRVLAITGKTIVVSHKKSLIQSEHPIITDHEAKEGTVTHSYIIRAEPNGCVVGFYNGITGFVPQDELAAHHVANVQKTFRSGQVMLTRIIRKQRKDGYYASFVMRTESIIQEEANLRAAYESYSLGEKVNATVVAVKNEGVEVTIQKRKADDPELKGFVLIGHLSDYPLHCQLLKAKLHPGDELKNLTVMRMGKSYQGLLLSKKPSIAYALKRGLIPSSQSELEVGKSYFGFVSKLLPFGVLVKFANGLKALSYKTAQTDKFSKSNNNFYVDQGVFAQVLETGANNLVSLRPSVNYASPSYNDEKRISSFFEEHDNLLERKVKVDWSNYAPGTVVEGTIVMVEEVGYILSFEGTDKLTGFANIKQADPDFEGAEGDVVKCFILDNDKGKGIVDVSLCSRLVEGAETTSAPAPTGSFLEATVELVQTHYLIVSVVNPATKKLALVSVSPFGYNDFYYKKSHSEFNIGDRVFASIFYGEKDLGGRYLGTLQRETEAGTKHKIIKVKNANVSSVSDITVGLVLKAVVTDIKALVMDVDIGCKVKAQIHLTEVFDDIPTGKNKKHPFSQFTVGQEIPSCRVIAISDRKAGSAAGRKKNIVVQVSVRPSILQSRTTKFKVHTWESLQKGQVVNAWIQEVTATTIWAYVGPKVRGQLFALDVSDNLNVLKSLRERYHKGDGLKCMVTEVDAKKHALSLSLKAFDKKACSSPSGIVAGRVLPGIVARVHLNHGMNIQLFQHVFGRVHIADITDRSVKDPIADFINKEGTFVEVYVINVDKETGFANLSMRESVLEKAKKQDKTPAPVPTPGSIVSGFVRNTDAKTCWISLPNLSVGRIFVRNLADTYIKNPAKKFPVGKRVTGTVLSVDPETNLVDVTLKRSERGTKLSFDDIKPDVKVTGVVKSVKDFGIFVTLNRCGFVGLCHISEADDLPVKGKAGLDALYEPGDRVTAKVLRVNAAKKQISLSLKPSHFAEGDALVNAISDESEEEEVREENSDSDEEEDSSLSMEEDSDDEEDLDMDSDEEEETPKKKKKKSLKIQVVEDSDEDSEDEEEDDEEEEDSEEGMALIKDSSKSSKINWGEVSDEGEDSDVESMEEDERDDKKTKKSKAQEKANKRKEIEEGEKEMMVEAETPTTTDDYEKLILGSPNSSYVWIQYMAYWITKMDITKARDVVKRALQRIDSNLDQEKLNIWVAYINMEYNYGDKETLAEVIRNALLYNDSKQIYGQLIKMYSRANDNANVEEMYKILTTKHKQSKGAWVQYGIWLFRQNKEKAARDLLKKALISLPQRKHVETISKFAQLEYQFGKPEIGRTVFEDLLGTYAKRIDLWCIYIDQETKLGNDDKIRELYERAVSLALSSKKMKFMLKRYLKFEQDHGDDEKVERIKEKAMAYVMSKQ
eukprot:TRINITY_DN4315_c0_g1_i2.p1 TRINITY_DN4315_c0_g1~~TRINITY_DN4315_c0_g1_i2.p1  ORF type:complete len:1841 (+),score=598.44 TRINITY_DN4315_c0_g1_i2:315-5837(+)